MAETTKGKKQPSKRAAVLLVWDRIQRPDISHEEFMRAALFLERNNPQWNRKPRRQSSEIVNELVEKIEKERRAFLQKSKGTQQ